MSEFSNVFVFELDVDMQQQKKGKIRSNTKKIWGFFHLIYIGLTWFFVIFVFRHVRLRHRLI